MRLIDHIDGLVFITGATAYAARNEHKQKDDNNNRYSA